MNSQFLKNYGSIYQFNFFRGDFPYLCALNEFPLKAGISYVLLSLPVLPDCTKHRENSYALNLSGFVPLNCGYCYKNLYKYMIKRVILLCEECEEFKNV